MSAASDSVLWSCLQAPGLVKPVRSKETLVTGHTHNSHGSCAVATVVLFFVTGMYQLQNDEHEENDSFDDKFPTTQPPRHNPYCSQTRDKDSFISCCCSASLMPLRPPAAGSPRCLFLSRFGRLPKKLSSAEHRCLEMIANSIQTPRINIGKFPAPADAILNRNLYWRAVLHPRLI